MGGKQNAVHALKLTRRANQVVMTTIAFDGPAAAFATVFRERLIAMCPQKFQPSVRTKSGRRDWSVIFTSPIGEDELDRLLIAIANELELLIYMDPGINESELTEDSRSFMTKVIPSHTKPSN